MKKEADYLKNISIFSVLKSEELQLLRDHLESVDFKKGDLILEQDKESRGLYIIESGRVGVFVSDTAGVENKIALVSEKNCIGEVSLVSGMMASASVKALVNVQCSLLTRPVFEALLILYPIAGQKIAIEIAKMISQRIRHSFDARKTNTEVINNQSMLFDQSYKKRLSSLKRTKPSADYKKYYSYLKKLFFFQSFSLEELNLLAPYLREVSIKKDQLLFAEGDRNVDAFYVLIYGAVQSVVIKDKKISKYSLVEPGGIIGELEYSDGGPRVASAVVRVDSLVLEIKRDRIAPFLAKSPTVSYKLEKLIYTSLGKTLRTIVRQLLQFNVPD